MELTPRKQKILSAIIELYTVSGEPVGSKVLCDSLDFSVSSATVRNEMSDLAAMGLLDQPHTSAGRVPSEKGYRVYLDELMQPAAVTPEERHFIDALLLPSAYDPEKLLDGVARILAGVSHMAAITTTPSGSAASVAGVQFVQTSRRTAMLILMTTSGTMHSRVFHCDFELSPEILRVFFRVFNEDLAGRRSEALPRVHPDHGCRDGRGCAADEQRADGAAGRGPRGHGQRRAYGRPDQPALFSRAWRAGPAPHDAVAFTAAAGLPAAAGGGFAGLFG